MLVTGIEQQPMQCGRVEGEPGQSKTRSRAMEQGDANSEEGQAKSLRLAHGR